MISSVHSILLFAHILGGMTGLLTGLLSLSTRKGAKVHRLSGKIYVAGMFLATLSGIVLAFWGGSHFLFLIGIFSFYLCFTGFRTLKHKKILQNNVFKPIDKIMAWIVLGFGCLMLTVGIIDLKTLTVKLNVILIVFGAICTGMAFNDLRLFFKKSHSSKMKQHWFFNHIGRMIGSYISAVTAFLVVNINFLPGLLIWLGPTVLGTIVITGFNIHYRRKFAKAITSS